MYDMTIEVSQEAPDRLSRKYWRFSVRDEMFILVFYGEQERATPRSKYKGPCWNRDDERPYNSAFKRPTEVPTDVLKEAHKLLIERVVKHPFDLHIGYPVRKDLVKWNFTKGLT